MSAQSVDRQRQHPIVYFDQSVWSSWQRGSYTGDAGQRLIDLAHNRRFLMAVSQWHIVETVKYKGERLSAREAARKLEHAAFVAKLPNLVALRPTHDVLIQEISRAYATHVGCPLASDPRPFAELTGLQDAVAQGLSKDAGYIPSGLSGVLVDPGGRGSMGWWSWLHGQIHMANVASHRAAKWDRDYARRPRTWLTGLQERLTIRWLVDMGNTTAHNLRRRAFAAGWLAYREQTAQYLGFEPRTVDFLKWLYRLDLRGSAALTYRVAYENLLGPTGERKPDENDALDAEHGFAAPFVDILVHESAHYEIARNAAKKAGLSCKVFNGRPKVNQLGAVATEIENWG